MTGINGQRLLRQLPLGGTFIGPTAIIRQKCQGNAERVVNLAKNCECMVGGIEARSSHRKHTFVLING